MQLPNGPTLWANATAAQKRRRASCLLTATKNLRNAMANKKTAAEVELVNVAGS